MYQIKTFLGYGREDMVNEWLVNNKGIEIVSITSQMFVDHYLHDGSICNEWLETTILYKTTERYS